MKIVIIEDDKEIVETINIFAKIRWPDADVLSASKGKDGIDIVDTEAPDIVIIDLGLPDIDGFKVLKEIRLFSNVPIIILTARSDEKDIVKGLELGADEYVVKPFSEAAFISRIQALLRRQHLASGQEPVTYGAIRFGPYMKKLNYKSKEIILTRTESIILYELIKSAGGIVSNTRLAETIWGDESMGTDEAIRVYIRRLREKLETDPGNPRLICTKVGLGYYISQP